MAPRIKSRFWRICGIYFRHFRMGMWLIILIFLGSLLYLNQVGLPGFVKKPLLEKLRARGLDLQFTRLRWRFDRGIVAENVRFGSADADESAMPQMSAKEVQLPLDYKALMKLRFQASGLVLRQGRLTWPVRETNGPPRELAVEGIQTDLHLLPGDLWQLDNFQAQFAGAQIRLAGVLTNASAVREWKLMRPKRPSPGLFEYRLRRLADTLENIHFASSPQLKVDIQGDARDLQSFSAQINLSTPDADTPWGTIQNGTILVQLHPATSNAWSHAELNLQAGSAQCRWANSTNLQLVMHLFSTGADTNVVEGNLDVAGENVETKWGQAPRARFTAQWLHSITNAIPLSGHGELEVDTPSTKWGSAAHFRLAGALLPADAPVIGDESWAWWTNLAPFALDWECQVRGVQSPKFMAEEVSCAGDWRAPRLTATRIQSTLYGGKLDGEAKLDVATRELKFSSKTDFDALKISPLLDEKAREWLTQFTWQKPPVVQGEGELVLPAWTNLSGADWEAEVRPTLHLLGRFRISEGTFRSVPFSSAESHFDYSDECWILPDVMAVRPEGRLFLFHKSSDLTRDFYFRFGSTINVRVLRPLLDPAAQREFDLLAFTKTPVMEGEVWGRWREPERTGLKARVALTNFSVRGESASDFQTVLLFTNRVLKLVEPRLHRGAQEISASSLFIDFDGNKIYLNNGVSTAEPMVVARAIGPQVARVLVPYRFAQPPTVRAEGIIPLRSVKDADLHFDVDGGPFEWWKFNVSHISGRVDWTGDQLALRDVQAQFYQGNASGNAGFDFRPRTGANFNFNVVASDANMHLLMNDLTGKSNKLEGLLTMRLSVTDANTEDWQTWQGKGRVNLRDGLIWEIPIFGIFSPVLDGIAPGLGSSRASEASATFDIINGVVQSDDLEIRTSGASAMRLQYWGTVNLKGDVNGRVQAELFRDTWVIGPVLSFVLWPVSKVFEYRVNGTLEQPRSEPVFIVPRILMMPFRPAPHSSKEATPEDGPGSIHMDPPPTGQ
jgi:AsmA-like C-terminal region